ncbi:MAG: hypothetical protein KME19_10750 [Microcoleus vaginatus WJT46-NPBG5]|jgi:glutamate formiminotransferase|nr:hypothetical protein [Microcoleus vaginatus WJT46-NPBG5]
MKINISILYFFRKCRQYQLLHRDAVPGWKPKTGDLHFERAGNIGSSTVMGCRQHIIEYY